MRFNSVRVALLAGLGLLLVPFATDASPSRARGSETPSRRRVTTIQPKRWTDAKLVKKINALLQSQGYQNLAAPPPKIEGLTPATPVLEGGTRIEWAGNISFQGPTEEVPTGVYWFDHGEGSSGHVDLDYATEVGKLYVLDCGALVHYQDGAYKTKQAKLYLHTTGQTNATVAGADGHVLYAFTATKEKTDVQIFFTQVPDLPYMALAWYGCGLIPAG